MYRVVKSLDLLCLNNNTMLKEVIGDLQELMVMDENVCELIRRGVNGSRARFLHFAILRLESERPIPHPSPNEALTRLVVRIEKKKRQFMVR